jgi:hypothetical protein
MSEWEPRPTLPHFHYTHLDPGDADGRKKPSAVSKTTKKQCGDLDDVRGSDLRIGSWWDDARKEAERLEKK